MLVKPESKAMLTTVQGEPLIATVYMGKRMLADAKGGMSMIAIKDVLQSNGVIHVAGNVLIP